MIDVIDGDAVLTRINALARGPVAADPDACPSCGGPSRVIDSRPHPGEIRRRRGCARGCATRWNTIERVVKVDRHGTGETPAIG